MFIFEKKPQEQQGICNEYLKKKKSDVNEDGKRMEKA